MEKQCSKCGITFGCKNEAPGCWCEDLKLTEATLKMLKDDFENCLCPGCLKEFELNQSEIIIIPDHNRSIT